MDLRRMMYMYLLDFMYRTVRVRQCSCTYSACTFRTRFKHNKLYNSFELVPILGLHYQRGQCSVDNYIWKTLVREAHVWDPKLLWYTYGISLLPQRDPL